MNPNIKDHGFGNFPAHINRVGANKGSKWKKNLLKELMIINLDQSELDQFQDLKAKFPSFFNSTEDKNFQLFMEVKQIGLVFHKDGKVSQRAINAIKDRIDGRPTQKIDVEVEDKIPRSKKERLLRIEQLKKKLNETE